MQRARGIFVARSDCRKAVVRALGRELRLRHQRRIARFETMALTAQEYCQRAVGWLRSVQNADGGFGESIASYYDAKLKGQGVSTPSQTAWGLIGLLAGRVIRWP